MEAMALLSDGYIGTEVQSMRYAGQEMVSCMSGEISCIETKICSQGIISYRVEMSPSWCCGNWIRVENNFFLTFPRPSVKSLFLRLEIHTRLNWLIIALWFCRRESYNHTPLSQAYSCRREWPNQSIKLLHRISQQQLYCIQNTPPNCLWQSQLRVKALRTAIA